MKNDTIKFGLMYAAASSLVILLTYFVDPKAISRFMHWSTALHFAAMLGLMYMAAKTAKEKKGGFIPFGEALVPSLGTFAIGSLLGGMGLFFYLLVNYFDPSLQPIMEEGAKEMSESMLDAMGLSEEQKLQQMEIMEEQQSGMSPFGLKTLILGWLMNLFVMGLPISAIIAAIIKKKEPMPIV